MLHMKNNSGVAHLFALLVVGFLGVGALLLSGSLGEFRGDTRSGAQTPITVSQTATFTIKNNTDVANEDGNTFIQPSGTEASSWLGTAGDTAKSFLGLRLSGNKIPKGATVTSAKVEFIQPQNSWISISFNIFGENSTTPAAYSTSSRPSARTIKTTASHSYADNVKWESTKTYSYDVSKVVQELVSSQDREVINLIFKGGNTRYGRKSFAGSPSSNKSPRLVIAYTYTTTPSSTPRPTQTPGIIGGIIGGLLGTPKPSPTATPGIGHGGTSGESMAMHAWKVGGKNSPNANYDKCDDGTDIVNAHNQYHVVAYDGIKYPTWHPPVVTNPITGNGKCYFGHEHGSNPQNYRYWSEIVQHFGKDTNGDGTITGLIIASDGKITPGDRAGLPFGLANEKMDQYYNQEGRDSIFVRHEDHVGHKIEFVNMESDMAGNTTHTMSQLANTVGVNIPYYKNGDSNTYFHTGVTCTHLHKFHQGTTSGDAIKNNMHEVVFHSTCTSVNVNNVNAASIYPNNSIILTGMMTFGDPGGYKRFCGNDRSLLVCPDGKNANGTCKVTDPLISKLPGSVYSDTLGRNMVDRSCLQNVEQITGSKYFTPYEIWQGDLRITTAAGKMIAEHGRQWDVLDPIRFVDPNSATGFSYNSEQCGPGGLLYNRTLLCGALESKNQPWDSPQSGFKGLKRTTYFGRNRVSNSGGSQTWWTDPLGGNAVTSSFSSGLKQKVSSVEADICRLSVCSTLNDRAIQRQFPNGNGTVHAPN